MHKITYDKTLNFRKYIINEYLILFFVHITKNALKFSFHFLSFYFLLSISRESIVFGSNFRSGDFDGITCFEVP